MGAEQGAEQHCAEGEAPHPVEHFMGAHFDVALAKCHAAKAKKAHVAAVGATRKSAVKAASPNR